MSTESVIAILGAIGTLLGVIALTWRQVTGDRFKRKVTESTNILSGYTQQVRDLNEQLDAIQSRHAAEMNRLTSQHHVEMNNMRVLHDSERTRWQNDRDRLEERVETLEAQVTALLLRKAT